MAIVNIKLTQNVIDMQKNIQEKYDLPLSITFNEYIDSIFDMQKALVANYSYSDGWSTKSNKLVLSWNDGTKSTYTGSVSPIYSSYNYEYGTAVINEKVLSVPGFFNEKYTGKVNYDYSVTNGNLSFSPTSGTVSAYSVTLDSSISPEFGSQTLSYSSKLNIDSSLNITGKINNITTVSDKILKSSSISGDFSVSASLNSYSLQSSTILGVVTKSETNYYDGSFYSIKNSSFYLDSDDYVSGRDLISNASLWGGNDTFNVELPGTLSESYALNAGKGNDAITVKGGGGKFSVNAGEGNDSVTLLNNAPKLTLGTGQDSVAIKSTSGKAYISDFNVKDDTIQLENAIFTKLAKTGNLSSANFISSATGVAKDKDDYVIYNSKTGVVSYDADGSGSVKAIEIALLGNKASLTVSDFVVI